MKVLLWIIRHPTLVFKILRCGRKHRNLNLETMRCDYCGKQFREVSIGEYSSKINNSLKLSGEKL